MKRRREKELQLESDLATASKEILRLRAMLKECSTNIPLDNNNQQTSTVWNLRAQRIILDAIDSYSHEILDNMAFTVECNYMYRSGKLSSKMRAIIFFVFVRKSVEFHMAFARTLFLFRYITFAYSLILRLLKWHTKYQ